MEASSSRLLSLSIPTSITHGHELDGMEDPLGHAPPVEAVFDMHPAPGAWGCHDPGLGPGYVLQLLVVDLHRQVVVLHAEGPPETAAGLGHCHPLPPPP